MIEHSQFLTYIKDYISKHPEVAAYINDFIAKGIELSRKEALERAADMEIALCVAIAKRYKGRDELILSKLKKWNGNSSLRWDDVIETLEK